MQKNKLSFLIAIILTLVGCNWKQPTSENKNVLLEKQYEIHYAKGFSVHKYANYTTVEVHNPWDSTRLLQTYILVDKEIQLPANLPKGILIRTPLSTIAAYSTIHCSSLAELQAIDILKGVCESKYVKVVEIQQKIKEGTIIDLGLGSNPDIEKLMLLNPQAIFASPISGQSYGNVAKMNIPIIETLDYTEPHPLGCAEWIRFYSLFIGKEQLADSLFTITVTSYNKIKAQIQKGTKRPSVFTDSKYRNSWNLPGGKSYMATMLADAGGNYVWAENNSATFLPLSFESVLDKAGDADIWLIKYYTSTDMTYSSLKNEYAPYAHFKAFKERNIWGCNTMTSSYYEDLPIHPDYILKDLASIFHPTLFPHFTSLYYKRLNE